ncbi:MAG: phenyllactate dehydratase [Evtepia sp.]|jgi:benzoyl-CoA reductase/2-hydroxyglutaryl-CoA dehydratase subunit BcrC/BadD/HgdB|nr:phenyllactate dehydratase [Evtepia sp.]
MDRLSTLIQDLYEAGRHPKSTIEASLKYTGKSAVGCFPLFLPEELIYASGFLPIGLWGGISGFQLADRYLQSFACSIMRANMELALNGSYHFLKAILVPSQCDTLKCVCENLKVALPAIPIIGVTIPNNRTIQAAHQQLLCEFDYITESLRKLQDPSAKPIPIEEAFEVYQKYRNCMMDFITTVPRYLNTITAKMRHYIIKAAFFMDKADYTRKMEALLIELKKQPEETFHGTRLIATGIMIDSEPVLDLLTDLKIAVVDDLLCQESMQFRTPPREKGSVLSKIAYRLLDLQAASVLYEPMKPRGNLLGDIVETHHVDAVLFCLMKFCDPEAFDQPLVKKDLKDRGIKMLSIEIDQHVDSIEQLRTRIQGFLEMNL